MHQYHHIFKQVYVAIDCGLGEYDQNYDHVAIQDFVDYQSFCNDFGPMNLGKIFRFVKLLKHNMEVVNDRNLALKIDSEAKSVTNAVALLGAYIILELEEDPSQYKTQFQGLRERCLPYRDISPETHNFELQIEDCWAALQKAKFNQWFVSKPLDFDVEEYEHYDNPGNADLHVIVPNKIVAMRGPSTLASDVLWQDMPDGSRAFSADHYGEILSDFNVKLVVRLNEVQYAASGFEKHGIAVADLPFEFWALPPQDVVVKFLLLVESLPGAVAVHCKSGLGRTGTLIAIYLMKNFNFTARQAIGWLRIVRPGSIIGPQQEYLCSIEASISRMREHPLSGAYLVGKTSCVPAGALTMEAVRGLIARIDDLVEKSKAKLQVAANRKQHLLRHSDVDSVGLPSSPIACSAQKVSV